MVFYFLFLERILSPASSAPVEEQDELGLAQFRDICDTSYQNISIKIFRWKHLWDPGEMTNTTDPVRSTKTQQKLQKHQNFSCPLGKSPHFSKTKNNQKLFKQTAKIRLTYSQLTKQIILMTITHIISMLYKTIRNKGNKIKKNQEAEQVQIITGQTRSNGKAFYENGKERKEAKIKEKRNIQEEQEHAKATTPQETSENQIKSKTEQKLNHMEDYKRGLLIHEIGEKKKKNKNTDPPENAARTTGTLRRKESREDQWFKQKMTLSKENTLRKQTKELSQDKTRKAQNNNDTRNRDQGRRNVKTNQNEETRTNENDRIKDSNQQSQMNKQKRDEPPTPPPPPSSSSSSEEEYDEPITEEEEEEEEETFEIQFFRMLNERRREWAKDEEMQKNFQDTARQIEENKRLLENFEEEFGEYVKFQQAILNDDIPEELEEESEEYIPTETKRRKTYKMNLQNEDYEEKEL